MRRATLLLLFALLVPLLLAGCTQSEPEPAYTIGPTGEIVPEPLVENKKDTGPSCGNQICELGERDKNTFCALDCPPPRKPAPPAKEPAKIPFEQSFDANAPCPPFPFTRAPTDLNSVQSIMPLGNPNPPAGHVTPTEHTYLHFHPGGSSDATYPLYAPADLLIDEVHIGPDALAEGRDEYGIRFAVCGEVRGYFNHVKEVTGELARTLADTPCADFTRLPSDTCIKQLALKVPAGTVIGRVGHVQGNFDFGATDARVTLPFANPARYYPETDHKVCPYDYYDDPLARDFRALFPHGDCGRVAQDVPGTLFGNWFYGDTNGAVPWSQQLSFMQSIRAADWRAVSVGGTITEPSAWRFAVRGEGTTNRDFDQITPDGKTYCFEAEDEDAPDGRLVVRMEDAQTLLLARQSGACTDDPQLGSGAKTYRR